MKHRWLCLFALVICHCGTAPATPESGPVEGAPDRTMMGLNDPAYADFWRDWTPGPHYQSPAGWVVFDHWVVDAPEDVERSWGAIVAVLDALRIETNDPNTQRALTMVMSTVEPPSDSSARMPLSYLVRDGAKPVEEAILAHFDGISRNLAPAVWIRVARQEGSGVAAIDLVADTGSTQAKSVQLTLRRGPGVEGGDGWRHITRPGKWVGKIGEETLSTESASQLAGILLAIIWTPYTDSNYVEATQGRPTRYIGVLPARERQIYEVASDTAFPPRLDTSTFVPKAEPAGTEATPQATEE